MLRSRFGFCLRPILMSVLLVHVINADLGILIKLNKIWPNRIIDIDLRASEILGFA